MISLVQGLWVFFIIFFLFFKHKYGIALYLAYLFLVPYMKIHLGITFQWNLVNLIVLLSSIYFYKKSKPSHKYDWKPLYPFVFYFVVSLLMMPFQDDMPINEMISLWRSSCMKFLILPIAIWNLILLDSSAIKLLRNTTLICVIVASIYGLFLTSMPGINPYIIALSEVNEEEFIGDAWLLAEGEGRLFGRISSVFDHPMTFGIFLGLSMIYLFFIRDEISKKIWIPLFIVIVLDVLFCGVRSVIGGIGVAVIYFLLKNKNKNQVIMLMVLGVISYYAIMQIPGMKTYVSSITSGGAEGVENGSSVEMRLDQFAGCLEEIKNSILFGKGFGWTGFYRSTVGIHPTLLSFESLLFVVLCNSGLIGAFLWVYMIVRYFKYNYKFGDKYSIILNSLFIFYLSYSLITGDYGYLQYFLPFYIIMLGKIYTSTTVVTNT